MSEWYISYQLFLLNANWLLLIFLIFYSSVIDVLTSSGALFYFSSFYLCKFVGFCLVEFFLMSAYPNLLDPFISLMYYECKLFEYFLSYPISGLTILLGEFKSELLDTSSFYLAFFSFFSLYYTYLNFFVTIWRATSAYS